ncbi:MAG: DUF5103 domain-containing protein [Dysgonomonas sp.]|nr:DUF5103 domain-containing protein [Dysgonomonas sp.]
MKRSLLFFAIFIFSCCGIIAQVLRTESLADDIRTIQVNANGNWKDLPVIDLNSNDFIRVNFDRLGSESSVNLRYRLVNCNADWTRSTLSDVEFMDGFNDILIEDYAYSMNTLIDYTNFVVDIPNDRIKIKLSGNYALEIFDEEDASKTLLRVCFSVLDSQVGINGSVSSLTDIDAHKKHQQVSFTINYNNLPVRDVFTDLKVFVRQNNRLDNQKSSLKPMSIRGTSLVFEHNRDLIFEAGNEYRRFESVSYRYNGLNIARTYSTNTHYITNVVPDKIRADNVYIYDQDQNGRFIIRNSEVDSTENDLRADYFTTNFTLVAPDPFIEPVYINGGFTNNTFDERCLMKYDPMEGVYKASVLLKQGAYNYQYLAKSGNNYTPSLIEGNYYETENEYVVYVYYRPLGQRYDLLVGMLLISNK